MKRFTDSGKMRKWAGPVAGIKMWLMATAVLLYLLNADLSTAPVYVYNQLYAETWKHIANAKRPLFNFTAIIFYEIVKNRKFISRLV